MAGIGGRSIILWLPFQIYWAASGGMTLLLGCWGIWGFHPKWLFPGADESEGE